MKKLIAIEDNSEIEIGDVVTMLKNLPIGETLGENIVGEYFVNKNPDVCKEQGYCQKVHLYVLDTELSIKNGDWYWYELNNNIVKAEPDKILISCYKIISSTNPLLDLPLIQNVEDCLKLIGNEIDIEYKSSNNNPFGDIAIVKSSPKNESLEEAALNSEIHQNLKSKDGSYKDFHNQSELFLNGAKFGSEWQREKDIEMIQGYLNASIENAKLVEKISKREKDIFEWLGKSDYLSDKWEIIYDEWLKKK
jgi:hypothetical protein